MKALILVALLFSSSAYSQGFFQQQDKQKHAAYSAVGANVLYGMGLTPKQAFFTMVGIGLLKELGDNNTNEEHAMDMVANTLGASSVFVWTIEF